MLVNDLYSYYKIFDPWLDTVLSVIFPILNRQFTIIHKILIYSKEFSLFLYSITFLGVPENFWEFQGDLITSLI